MDDTCQRSEETLLLERGIRQLNAGDASVRGELLNIACARLVRLTARLRRHFQGLDGAKSTEAVFQNASLRLYQALHDTPIKDVRHFYRLAAIQIRRELIDLCHQCQDLDLKGDESGRVEASYDESISVGELRRWALFHDSVDALPESEREVFELIWYHELGRTETAELLGEPVAEVRRLWRSARLKLHDLLGEHGLLTNTGGD